MSSKVIVISALINRLRAVLVDDAELESWSTATWARRVRQRLSPKPWRPSR